MTRAGPQALPVPIDMPLTKGATTSIYFAPRRRSRSFIVSQSVCGDRSDPMRRSFARIAETLRLLAARHSCASLCCVCWARWCALCALHCRTVPVHCCVGLGSDCGERTEQQQTRLGCGSVSQAKPITHSTRHRLAYGVRTLHWTSLHFLRAQTLDYVFSSFSQFDGSDALTDRAVRQSKPMRAVRAAAVYCRSIQSDD